jgi:hypothetical protein
MRTAAFIAVCLALAAAAHRAAAVPILETDRPVGSPLVVEPGTTSTMTMTVSIRDTGPGMDPEDNLTGFNVALKIVPVGVPNGMLTFATPMTSPTAAEPVTYVFESVANNGLNVANTGGDLFAYDFVTGVLVSTSGVDVTESGYNLISLTFTASMDALGAWDIVAVPGAGNTQWADNATGGPVEQPFANVPNMGGQVTIGRVSAVPEAGAALFLALAAAAGGAWRIVRRVRGTTT